MLTRIVLIVTVLLTAFLVVQTAVADPQAALQTSSAVDIPEDVELGFAGLMIALWTAGFVYIFERTGLDLRSYAVPIATTISVFLVGLAQDWINTLDPLYDPTVMVILRVLGALLAGFGVLRLLSHKSATLIEQV